MDPISGHFETSADEVARVILDYFGAYATFAAMEYQRLPKSNRNLESITNNLYSTFSERLGIESTPTERTALYVLPRMAASVALHESGVNLQGTDYPSRSEAAREYVYNRDDAIGFLFPRVIKQNEQFRDFLRLAFDLVRDSLTKDGSTGAAILLVCKAAEHIRYAVEIYLREFERVTTK